MRKKKNHHNHHHTSSHNNFEFGQWHHPCSLCLHQSHIFYLAFLHYIFGIAIEGGQMYWNINSFQSIVTIFQSIIATSGQFGFYSLLIQFKSTIYQIFMTSIFIIWINFSYKNKQNLFELQQQWQLVYKLELVYPTFRIYIFVGHSIV